MLRYSIFFFSINFSLITLFSHFYPKHQTKWNINVHELKKKYCLLKKSTCIDKSEQSCNFDHESNIGNAWPCVTIISIFDVCLEAALNIWYAYDRKEGSEVKSNLCDGLCDKHAEIRDEDVLYCFNCKTGRIVSCMWLWQ